MCRSGYERGRGGALLSGSKRRCPCHSNPLRKALATAVQSMTRLERRADKLAADGDEAKLRQVEDKLIAAIERVSERGQLVTAEARGDDPAALQAGSPLTAEVPESAVTRFTPDVLAGMDEEQLLLTMGEYRNDPLVEEAVVAELERRDAIEAERLDFESASAEVREWMENNEANVGFAPLKPEQIFELSSTFEKFPELQEQVGKWLGEESRRHREWVEQQESEATEWDRYNEARENLSDLEREDLERAWAAKSDAEVMEIERSLFTDPTLRTSREALRARGTVAERRERAVDEYEEHMQWLSLECESAARGGGHLKARYRHMASELDPDYLFRTPKAFEKYASDEYKSAVNARGGLISKTRWLAERGFTAEENRVGAKHEGFNDVFASALDD